MPGGLDRGEVLHAGVLASASDELRDLGQTLPISGLQFLICAMQVSVLTCNLL